MSSVKRTDPILPDMQAHILKHHGREHAYHLFLTFKTGKVSQVKKAIKAIAEHHITSAKRQLDDAHKRSLDDNFDGGPVLTFSLSSIGYDFLGISDAFLTDPSFKAGAKGRITALHDNIDDWDFGFTQKIHALIIVADDTAANLFDLVNTIKDGFKHIADLVVVQKGQILRNSSGVGIEHFGYADGISQPIYLDDEIGRQGDRTQWNDEADLARLLVKDDNGKHGNQSQGSYFVFRKLEQNVKAFRSAEDATAENPVILKKVDLNGAVISSQDKFLATVKDENGLSNSELAGAMVVGRFEDSSETVNDSRDRGVTKSFEISNDFDYRDDTAGLKCPYHAHIRLTNPRADIKAPGDAKNYRITRRAMPYNDVGRNEKDLDVDIPSGGVGLLFQCYQSSIAGQFEVLQKFWASEGTIANDPNSALPIDGVIGQDDPAAPNTNPKFLPERWGSSTGKNPVSFSGFVTNRGGEYFFTPSISSLKGL